MTTKKPPAKDVAQGCVVLIVGVVLAVVMVQRCLSSGAAPPQPANSDVRTPERIAEDEDKLAEMRNRRFLGPGTTADEAPPTLNRETLRRSEFGSKWPLSVDEGTVVCIQDAGRVVIFFESDGTRYAVNGTSKGPTTMARFRLQRINDIWLDNPELPGTKISIGPVLDAGLRLCRAQGWEP